MRANTDSCRIRLIVSLGIAQVGREVYAQFVQGRVVVKAQIHAGGRGLGKMLLQVSG